MCRCTACSSKRGTADSKQSGWSLEKRFSRGRAASGYWKPHAWAAHVLGYVPRDSQSLLTFRDPNVQKGKELTVHQLKKALCYRWKHCKPLPPGGQQPEERAAAGQAGCESEGW